MNTGSDPLKGLAPYWFTPVNQQNKENPRRYEITPLDGIQRAQVSANSLKNEGVICIRSCIRYGLTDWENIHDDDGNPIEYSPLNFGRLDDQDLFDIAMEIYHGSTLKEEQRKNS